MFRDCSYDDSNDEGTKFAVHLLIVFGIEMSNEVGKPATAPSGTVFTAQALLAAFIQHFLRSVLSYLDDGIKIFLP